MLPAFRNHLFPFRRPGERAATGAVPGGPAGGARPLARSAWWAEPNGVPHGRPVRGWIFYDAECALCVEALRRVRRLFASRGFEWVPLQTPGSAARLGVPSSAFQTRFHVLTADGDVFHNADALAVLCRSIWWLWPPGFVLSLPGFRSLGRLGYDWLARHRYCLDGHCTVTNDDPQDMLHFHWLPVLLFPVIAGVMTWSYSPWVFMWAVAFALYAGCKWLTFAEAISMRGSPRPARAIGYLFAWPGMDACSFLRGSPAKAPPWRALAWGIFNVLAGVISVWVLTPALISQSPLLAGWVGMIGVVLFLHFGIFAILAWLWQRLGVSATPVMRSPLAATSLGEFWSKRWNTAFHSLAQHCIFQPLKARLGARGAAITVFFVSGLTHDLVISVPARAGFGLPTLYFLVQGFGVLFERTTVARKLGLGKGTRGWLFALIVAAGPSFWLFHPPFIRDVILPFLSTLGAALTKGQP